MAEVTTDIRRRIALWVAIIAVALAAAVALSQTVTPPPPRGLENIELQHHRKKCSDYKKGSDKRRNCREDCGFGRARYGKPPRHPNHPRQCRKW